VSQTTIKPAYGQTRETLEAFLSYEWNKQIYASVGDTSSSNMKSGRSKVGGKKWAIKSRRQKVGDKSGEWTKKIRIKDIRQ
jgi:hypothetical protein